MAACDDCPVFPLNGGPNGTCLPPPVTGPLCVVPVVTGATPAPANETCGTPICVFLQGRCNAGVLTMGYYDGPSAGAVLVGPVGAFTQVRCPEVVRGAVTVAGVATATSQALQLAQLIEINAGTPAALGQTTMANSASFALASDQSPIPVTGTVAVTGGATATTQTLQLAELAAINAGTPAALGQTTMANSAPFVLASDQSPIPTNPLKRPATARQLAAIATSSTVQTTAGVLAISMIARGADIRYRVTAVTSTAVAADHLIIQNERLDIAVFSGGFISAIRDAATSGTLEISELV